MLCCIWIRTLLNQWIYLINIASLVAAFTDPMQCNIVSLVATNWFHTQQQVIALTLISVFSVLGPIGGSFYSLIFINPNITDIPLARNMMFNATLYIAITYTCIYIPFIFIFKEKPEHPPW